MNDMIDIIRIPEFKKIPNSLNRNYFKIYLAIFLFSSNLSILLNIPIYQQVLGFIYLTIFPGIIVTKIMKLEKVALSITIIFSIGISIYIIMFVGLCLNIIGPIIGVSKPLSFYPLCFCLLIINLFLIIVDAKTDKKRYINAYYRPIKYQDFKILPYIYLITILVLGILSSLIIRYFQNAIISGIYLLAIAISIYLVLSNKLLSNRYYSLLLYSIAVSVILSRTLTSPYLFGSDIHYELYFSQLVKLNSCWNPNISDSPVNSMLSTVIIPPVYSILLNIDIITIYKVIYPIIFALLPVGLYEFYRKESNDKDAFFSSFLFISFYSFFTTMSWLPRQQLAEFALVSFMLSMMICEISQINKSFLLILFLSLLIVSHYGTTYIFILYILLALLIIKVIRIDARALTPTIAFFGVASAIAWYIYVTNSSSFNALLSNIVRIYSAISSDIISSNTIDPEISKALGSDASDRPFFHMLGVYWQIVSQVFIGVGFIYTMLSSKKIGFKNKYLVFSTISMVLIVLCIVVPYLATSLNMNRIYPITLIFLSPCCIIGMGAISKVIYMKSIPKMPIKNSMSYLYNFTKNNSRIKYYLILLFFIPYFLFNTGLIFELTEHPENFIRFKSWNGNDHIGSQFNWSYFISSPIPEEDVYSCMWLSNYANSSMIYTDSWRQCEPVGYGSISPNHVNMFSSVLPKNGIIFLGYQNIIDNILIVPDPRIVHKDGLYNLNELNSQIEKKSLIYNNGFSWNLL